MGEVNEFGLLRNFEVKPSFRSVFDEKLRTTLLVETCRNPPSLAVPANSIAK